MTLQADALKLYEYPDPLQIFNLLMNLFISKWISNFNSLLSQLYALLSQTGQKEHIQACFCFLLTCPQHLSSTFLLSGTRCPDLYFPCPSSRSPGAFAWKMIFKSQDLSARCYWGVTALSPPQFKELGNMYMRVMSKSLPYPYI